MLKVVGLVNKLSKPLQKKIEERIKGFGDKVTYRFNISNQNPDPEATGVEKIIYNLSYTLDPRVFEIFDADETEGSKYKTIQLVSTTKMNANGHVEVDKNGKVQVKRSEKGVKTFHMNKKEDAEMVWFIELHPKLTDGLFVDKEKHQIIVRIDDAKDAKTKIASREARRKAETFAANMTDVEVLDFAQSMGWEVKVEPLLLKDRVEQEAETNAVAFNDLVEGKEIAYRSLVFKALDKGIVKFDTSSYGFYWVGNNQPISILSPEGAESANNKFATWLQVSDAEQKVYKKIKSLVETR